MRVHNPTNQLVSIVRVATGCGCVTASVEPVVIPSQGFGHVEFVAVDPPRAGPLSTHESVIQCSNGAKIDLPIDGYVREPLEAYLVETETHRGMLVVSNDGSAFSFDGRRYLTGNEHQCTARGVLVELDANQLAGIAETGTIAFQTDQVITIRVATLDPNQQIDTSLPHERLEITRSTSPDSTQPRFVLLRQGGVAVIASDAELSTSITSTR